MMMIIIILILIIIKELNVGIITFKQMHTATGIPFSRIEKPSKTSTSKVYYTFNRSTNFSPVSWHLHSIPRYKSMTTQCLIWATF